jgi:hypothetical protein
MANNPQKAKDATEEALSAIQEALDVRGPESRASPDAEKEAPPPATPPAPDLFPQETTQPWPLGDSAPRRAANDDRAGIGQILQTLRHRSSRTPYVAAAVGGFIWIIGGLAIASLYGAEMRTIFTPSGIGLAALVALATVLVVPALFFSCSRMFTRAQDMRVMRNPWPRGDAPAQPETIAHESIVTDGQAIRRELGMGDGVECALARAAELEALCDNEVLRSSVL